MCQAWHKKFTTQLEGFIEPTLTLTANGDVLFTGTRAGMSLY